MLYSFGDCVIDTERRELRRQADLVDVEPQVFDLLVYLIGHREHVVSKDELTAVIWKLEFVSDAAIDSRIYAARRAIGESGKQPRFIRTLPKKGFRFVGDVREDRAPAPLVQALVTDAAAEVSEAGQTTGKPDSARDAIISNTLPRQLTATRLPEMPTLLIGRDDDLARLKEHLAIPDNKLRRPIIVIRGWPGVGKTSLVNALAYDF